jgi:hypothetical protein
MDGNAGTEGTDGTDGTEGNDGKAGTEGRFKLEKSGGDGILGGAGNFNLLLKSGALANDFILDNAFAFNPANLA